MELAKALNFRPRRVKELFKLLELFYVVCEIFINHRIVKL